MEQIALSSTVSGFQKEILYVTNPGTTMSDSSPDTAPSRKSWFINPEWD